MKFSASRREKGAPRGVGKRQKGIRARAERRWVGGREKWVSEPGGGKNFAWKSKRQRNGGWMKEEKERTGNSS